MIRVLHVINWFRRGGLETQLLRILRDYDRSRFHIDACCIGADEGYLADEARSYGTDILRCPKSVAMLGFSRRFARLVAGRSYDVVHSHFDIWSGPVLHGAEKARVPVRIAHMRTSRPGGIYSRKSVLLRPAKALLWWRARRWIERHATQVVGVSEATLDARWPRWRDDPKRYTVWTGGVDTSAFLPGESQSPPGKGRGGVLIFVGSLLPLKNHGMLIEVLSRVARRSPEVVLRLAGVGPEEAAMRRTAVERGLANQVELLGLRDDVPELLADADVFVSCSKVEGLPNVVLEAQAAGVPVVASDIPPHREALAPELHPFLFPLDDPEKACDSVLTVLKDAALRRRLGEAGRRFVAERFDSGRALRRLQEMYVRWVR